MSGIRSTIERRRPHWSHWEGGLTIDRPLGKRSMQTFRKLPTASPSIVKIAVRSACTATFCTAIPPIVKITAACRILLCQHADSCLSDAPNRVTALLGKCHPPRRDLPVPWIAIPVCDRILSPFPQGPKPAAGGFAHAYHPLTTQRVARLKRSLSTMWSPCVRPGPPD